VIFAQPGNEAPRLYLVDIDGSETKPITPEGFPVGRTGWSISPDATTAAVSSTQGVVLHPLDGGAARTVPGSQAWTVVDWIEGGLLVSADPTAGGGVLRIDPATGRSETWANIQPRDPAGIMTLDLTSLMVTPDGRSYGYSWHRAMSDLYLVEGWS
jgi:hypothetical protein